MKGYWLKKSVTAAAAVCMVMGFSIAAEAAIPSDLWDYIVATDENDNIVYEFKEVEVTLPADWSGKFGIIKGQDYLSFYHPASREAMKAAGWTPGGNLFSIHYSQDYSFTENVADYYIVGSGAEGVYYMMFPTDVQGYPNDANIWNEWLEISNDEAWIKEHVAMINGEETSDGTGVLVNMDNLDGITGEYILADSSTRYLSENELSGMNADELQMAINEIYARHHRKFVIKEIQDYFNKKSWYSGTVEANDFDPNVMNQYEGANIGLLLQCMNRVKNNGSTVSNSEITVVNGATMQVTADMNIRSGASSQTAILGVVPVGNSVTVTGSTVNGWVPIRYNQIQGYIYQDYLK